MNYNGPKFVRPQIVLFVQVAIASAIDMLTSARPGRYMAGSDVSYHVWQKECKDYGVDADKARGIFQAALTQLGWNLSILWATLHHDGMGVSDALEHAKLLDELESWATDWIDGVRGVIPNPVGPPGSGHYDLPDTLSLAEKWVTETFGDYNLRIEEN